MESEKRTKPLDSNCDGPFFYFLWNRSHRVQSKAGRRLLWQGLALIVPSNAKEFATSVLQCPKSFVLSYIGNTNHFCQVISVSNSLSGKQNKWLSLNVTLDQDLVCVRKASLNVVMSWCVSAMNVPINVLWGGAAGRCQVVISCNEDFCSGATQFRCLWVMYTTKRSTVQELGWGAVQILLFSSHNLQCLNWPYHNHCFLSKMFSSSWELLQQDHGYDCVFMKQYCTVCDHHDDIENLFLQRKGEPLYGFSTMDRSVSNVPSCVQS